MARMFLLRSLAVLLALALVLQTLDLLGESGNVLAYKGNGSAQLWTYLSLRLPEIIAFLLPFSILLGTIITLATLSIARGLALDCFSYAGGFALQLALKAKKVTAVEISEPACEQIKKNAERNKLANIETVCANVFDYLRDTLDEGKRFDTIVLDPPSVTMPRSCMIASNAPACFAACFANTCASMAVLLISHRSHRQSATAWTRTPALFGSTDSDFARA